MPIRVMTIVGTRPEIIKLSRVMAELDRHTDHVVVHTGQNYDHELNEIFFEQLGIRKPDYLLEAAGATAADTIGNVISRADAVIANEEPNALLVLGDTNSCLAAIAAKRRRIPVFHMEAGNRCFDQRVPEEINRKLVDHVSDINLVYTEHARRYLLAEGFRPETVIKTGSPMKEVLQYYLPQIEASDVLSRLGLTPGEYFVVSAHREENVDSPVNFSDLLETLRALADQYGKPVVVSTHPRIRKKLDAQDYPELPESVRFLKPFGFFDYVKLQQNAFCVLSDSGTLTEESSILGFPAVMLREAHERPEGMDETVLIMCGLKPGQVNDAINVAVAHSKTSDRPFRLVPDYDTDNVSRKVLRLILSYVDYVNRTVWHKF
jgi:UDP-N-acetylglucosamine 2-epimerase (non-hydrolysing)